MGSGGHTHILLGAQVSWASRSLAAEANRVFAVLAVTESQLLPLTLAAQEGAPHGCLCALGTEDHAQERSFSR